MENKQNKRTPNFSNDEKSVLTQLIMKFKDVVENKKSDATTNAEKARGWKLLADEFNALSTNCGRTPESLKTCWENIKRLSKKQSASRKRELFKTGGGRPYPPPASTGSDCFIEAVLGPALEGLENPYDGDALLDKNDTDATKLDTEDSLMGFELSGTKEVENKVVLPVENEAHTSQSQLENKENDNTWKWEGWTPTSLKRPVSEVLRLTKSTQDSTWLKRRRPDQQNMSDKLLQEKIDLIKLLADNIREESKIKLEILKEQLKQEKIRTQKLCD